MSRGLVTAVCLAHREYEPLTLKLVVRHVENGSEIFCAPHLKEPHIVSIVHYASCISVPVNYPVREAVYRLFELNWAWRFCVHLTSFSD